MYNQCTGALPGNSSSSVSAELMVEYNHTVHMTQWMLCPLVIAPVGMRNGSGGISTRLLYTILNSKIVLIRAFLSLSFSQPSCDSMLMTLLVCR